MPEAAGRIHHVPHGAPTPFLAPAPLDAGRDAPADHRATCPARYLGYIGSLEDRVDWELMDRISRTFPEASIVVVGRVRDPVDEPWWNDCARFLSRPNVHAIGWRAAGSSCRVLPGVRRVADPLSPGPSVQPGLQPDQDHGRDGLGPADRRDGDPRVPPARRAVPRRRERRRVHRRGPDGSSTSNPTTAAPALRHAYALANTCHGIGERILDLIEQVARRCRHGRRAGPARSLAERARSSGRFVGQRPMATRAARR